MRSDEIVARLGGDEFALLLENLAGQRAVDEASERVLRPLREPFELRGRTVLMTASMGVAVRYQGGPDAEAVVSRADMAMYVAKGQGKAQYEVFDDGVHAAVVSRLAREAALQEAVHEQQFVLHYQPIVDLDSERVVGFEALLRLGAPRARARVAG